MNRTPFSSEHDMPDCLYLMGRRDDGNPTWHRLTLVHGESGPAYVGGYTAFLDGEPADSARIVAGPDPTGNRTAITLTLPD